MKRRKINYVPGMISLIFLPILCVWYLNEHKNILRVLEISYASKYTPNFDYKNHIRFDTSLLFIPENRRKYYDILICESESKNSESFHLIENKLDQIIKTKNKSDGIHISFSDNSTYGSYIKIIDLIEQCFKRNSAGNTYCPYTNNIWVLYLTQENIVKPKVYPLNLEGDIVFGRTIKDEINDFTYKNSNTIKLWPFIVIFVIFSIISIRYIKNKTTK